MVEKLLVKTGAMLRAHEMMYKVLVQMVLIYGSDGWVVMDAILKVI